MDVKECLRYLKAQGLCCAQVMMQMGLYVLRKENTQLVQSAAALCGGVHSGYTCGALTGAACMLSLFDPKAGKEMIPQLTEWFEDVYGARYGGVNCSDIVQGQRANIAARCPELIEQTYLRAAEILQSYGFDTSLPDVDKSSGKLRNQT